MSIKKDSTYRIRTSERDKERAKKLADRLECTESEVIRRGVKLLYSMEFPEQEDMQEHTFCKYCKHRKNVN